MEFLESKIELAQGINRYIVGCKFKIKCVAFINIKN